MWGLPGMQFQGGGAGWNPADLLAAAAAIQAAQGGACNQQLQAQLQQFSAMYPAPGCLGQSMVNVAQSSIPAETPHRKRNLQDEADPAAFFDKRQRLDAPPTDEDLIAFRLRYPMDERAFDYLTSAPAAAQQKVLSEFQPRAEGEEDYSSLITTRVKRARLAMGSPAPALSSVASSPSATADSASFFDRGDQPPSEEELAEFRLRYPMDERAFNYLSTAPAAAQIKFLSQWRPKTEGEADYSSLVTTLVKRFRLSVGSTAAPLASLPASTPLRYADYEALLGKQQQAVEAPSEEELLLFRLRYPMDDRAFEYLATAPAAAQQKVLTEFRPKNEGEGDYSSLVTTLVKRFRLSVVRPAAPLTSLPASSSAAGQEWRDLRDALRNECMARAPAQQTSSGQQWRDLRDALRDACGKSDTPGNGWPDMNLSGQGQAGGRLQEFRARYPMDDRAFNFLEQAGAAVQEVVLSDFHPKREGETDHSAPVTSFIKVVKNRQRNLNIRSLA